MFGHGCLLVELEPFGSVPDGGAVGVLPCVLGAGVVELELLPELVVVDVLGEAAAPAIPATAPPVASAPVTIVAPSSFEMVMS